MNKCIDYQRFFEQCPVGLYKTSLDDGLFLEINPFGAKLLGYNSPKEVIGKVYSTEIYDKKVRDKLKKILNEKNSVSDFEIELETSKGKVWLSATGVKQENFIIGSFTDISQRKAMEQEIETLKLNKIKTLEKINKDVKQRCEALDMAS